MAKNRVTEAGILRHHDELGGSLRCRRIKSSVLGIRKPYYVYEPPDFDRTIPVPVIYLFRGHEREWVNIREDGTRGVSTAIQDIDLLIQREVLPPVVLVMPGISSTNNAIHSLGIDMMGDGIGVRGIGSGQFWTYLTTEFIPMIENRYRSIAKRGRVAIGFSLGGYLCSLLGIKFPGYFDHIGIYDGTLPFAGFRDSRVPGSTGCSDRLWCRSPLLDPALGVPRQLDHMAPWNSVDLLKDASFHELYLIRQTTFWIASAAFGGYVGNRDRSKTFVEELNKQSVPSGIDDVVFADDAAHTWHWTDRFATSMLFRLFAAASQARSGNLASVAEHLFEEAGTTG